MTGVWGRIADRDTWRKVTMTELGNWGLGRKKIRTICGVSWLKSSQCHLSDAYEISWALQVGTVEEGMRLYRYDLRVQRGV